MANIVLVLTRKWQSGAVFDAQFTIPPIAGSSCNMSVHGTSLEGTAADVSAGYSVPF